MKHTNKLTDEEIQEEIAEILESKVHHISDLASLRLTNLQNEKQYRETIQKETICH